MERERERELLGERTFWGGNSFGGRELFWVRENFFWRGLFWRERTFLGERELYREREPFGRNTFVGGEGERKRGRGGNFFLKGELFFLRRGENFFGRERTLLGGERWEDNWEGTFLW